MEAHSLLLQLVLVVAMILHAAQAVPQPNPNCLKSCGSVHIPFPFGMTNGCALDSSFLITCNNNTSPKNNSSSFTPFLSQTNFSVSSISLLDGELRIPLPVGSACFYRNHSLLSENHKEINLTHFSLSSSRNILTAVGCNKFGLVLEIDSNNTNKMRSAGCVSLCGTLDVVVNGSCSGTGCCQVPLPDLPPYQFSTVQYGSTGGFINIEVKNFSRCGYGFLAEIGAYNFLSTDITSGRLNGSSFPVVLDWAVGNQTCQEAQKNASSYACRAEHSECYNSNNRAGYLCNCSLGFEGNPYLYQGCKDVNECEKSSHDCSNGATCNNLPGSYRCSCPKGYEGDGRKDGTRCTTKSNNNIVLIIGLSVVAVLVVSFYVNQQWKKRKLNELKEQWFQQNGGLLLQQKITRHRGSTEIAKVFTEEDLKKATNNFDKSKILGQGGQGTVYKGLLEDNRFVAIKKSKINDPNQIEQFINEVVVLSQINHRNVVKLLGCCLETEVPLLVYEFILNGTVSEHLHDQNCPSKLTWETRLRIAAETAEALAYLHSATSPSIIHRDVKTTNILLDRNLTAKVSDFGASRIVPIDQTQLTTLVQGTLGYLDPEYFQTGHLTEKSDVYSFGVVLAELLTRRKAVSFALPESDRNLAVYFVSSLKEGRLLDIIDKYIITDDARVEQLNRFASIAGQCLRANRDERPSMKKVAMELDGLRVEENPHLALEETGILLKSSSPPASVLDVKNGASGSGISYGSDSMNHISMSLGGGR